MSCAPSLLLMFCCVVIVFFVAISAREHASTKKQAAQNTSLSLVRQLFHMGVLEAAEPGQLQPKKKKVDEVKTK